MSRPPGGRPHGGPRSAPQPIGSNLPLASSLPKVSFRRIPPNEAQDLSIPAGVDDSLKVGYGFNDGEPFEKPEHYMRFVEPIEADLKRQVEYDMDEQDKEWIDALNAERKKEGSDAVSYETFEIMIDRLEKEWFDLMKRVPPKPTPAAIGPDGEVVNQSEDTECAICDDGECENSNAIVFCDGCNLAVHQDCYGIPYIPEGQWLCRKCTVSPDRAVSCVLCPNEGGAFKQTTQGKWAHLLCAMWIPETGVSNPVYMEPIDSVERIPKARWKLQCYLCHSRHGACIQCDNKSCVVAFHVTCGRKAGLLVNATRQRHDHRSHNDDDDGETLKAMCHKHLPRSMRRQNAANATQDDDAASATTSGDTGPSTPVLPTIKPASRKITIRRGANGSISAVVATAPTATATKSARAYKKSYRAGPPLVPAYIVSRVFDYMSKVHLRRKQPLVIQIAKFWSLKREARRGAPLLKRLHLEPWTAMTAPRELSDAERAKKLRFVMAVREDLEKQRMLVELVRKREREKLKQADVIRSALDAALFPAHAALKEALGRIVALDKSQLFASPVSRSEVPDYYDVVKEPMEWATITARVDDHYYQRVEEFERDVRLVPDNAILYNKPETSFHRAALRIKKGVEPILQELRGLPGAWHGDAAEELQLEPPAKLLEALGAIEEGAEALPVVADLLRQFYRPPSPPPPQAPERATSPLPAPVVSKSAKRKGRASAASTATPAASKRRRLTQDPKTPATPAPSTRPARRPRGSAAAAAVASPLASPPGSTSSSPRNATLRVRDVTDHDSFKRFEDGWILPKGSRRSRTTGTKSSDDEKAKEKEASGSRSRSAGKDKEASGSSRTSGKKKKEEAEEEQPQSSGSRARRSLAKPTPTTPAPAATPSAGPSRRPRTSAAATLAALASSPSSTSSPMRGSGDIGPAPTPSRVTPSGTLVWAKYGSHPYYPAEVVNEKDESVPSSVRAAKPPPPPGHAGQRMHLVQFFDHIRSFGWAPTGLCRMLLEDEGVDETMVRLGRKQSAQLRKAVQRARRARDGVDEEGEESE